MICSSCLSDTLVGEVEKKIACGLPRESLFFHSIWRKSHVEKCKGKCSCCGRNIIIAEPSFSEDCDDCVVKEVGAFLTKQITACEQCGTGEFFASYSWSRCKMAENRDEELEAEEEIHRLDTTIPIEDLFWDYFSGCNGLGNRLDEVAGYVYCPNCGNGSGVDYDDKINYGDFDRYTSVYTKECEDEFALRFYGDEKKVEDTLEDFLQKYSYEELDNIAIAYFKEGKVAEDLKALNENLKNLYNDDFCYRLSENRIVYRTRVSDVGVTRNVNEIWAPPADRVKQNRYNFKGHRVFYCANSICAIKAEVPKEKDQIYSIGKFLLNEEFLLFPINRVFLGKFDGLVSSEDYDLMSNGEEETKKGYILTNILADMIEKIGYDGIVYRSTKANRYLDYALFCSFKEGEDIVCLEVLSEQ